MDNIVFQYIAWHFVDAAKGILRGWGNCLKFNLNYWSAVTLIKTFLSPWRRYQYSYGKGFDFGRYFEVFTFNLFSRIIGAVLRIVFIALGLATEIFLLFGGLVVILFWIAMPVLIIAGFLYGFNLLF